MTLRRICRYSLLATFVLLTAFCAVSWFAAGSLLAPANRKVGPPPVDLNAESLPIESDSGSTLAAWYIPNPDANATIVLFHSIRGDRRSMLGRARLFAEAGFSLLMIDFQAHGESKGSNITIGYLERHDVRATLKFAKRLNPDHRIGVVGCSLGGASTLLASPVEIDALVLESVYPTLVEAVNNRLAMRFGPLKCVLAPALLCQLKPRLGITPDDLRPIDFVEKVGCPILIAAGDRDEHTPIDETMQMYESAADPKTLVVFHGARHVDLLKYDPLKYESEILGFFKANLKPLAVSIER